MTKILAKAGDSLADVYDVQGSIAGVEDLLSEDVNLVHEMGGAIHSERLSGQMLILETGEIAQNLAFDIGFTVGATPVRLLAIAVMVRAGSRLTRVAISITDVPPTITDVPIFAWDSTDSVRTIPVVINGVASNKILLLPSFGPQVPNMFIGTDQPDTTPVVNLRGLTSGFGAGTENITLVAYVAFPVLRGVSSRGLPIPSW